MSPYKIHNMSNDNETWPEEGRMVVFITKERFGNAGTFTTNKDGKKVFRVVSRFATLDFNKDEIAEWVYVEKIWDDYKDLYNKVSYIENLVKNGQQDALTFRKMVCEVLNIKK